MITGIVGYLTLSALGMIGETRSPSEKLDDALMEIGTEFNTLGHLPWDDTAQIQDARLVGQTIKFTISQPPGNPDTVKAVVCNFRDLREIIYDGGEVEFVWRPSRSGSVMGTTVVNFCPSLRG